MDSLVTPQRGRGRAQLSVCHVDTEEGPSEEEEKSVLAVATEACGNSFPICCRQTPPHVVVAAVVVVGVAV